MVNDVTDEMVEAAARAICRNQYLAGHAADAVELIVEARWKGFSGDARAALTAALSIRQGGVKVSDDDNPAKWRENVEAMLSSGDPDVVRCFEGGGPESLIGSLVLTVMRTRNSRDSAISSAKGEANA